MKVPTGEYRPEELYMYGKDVMITSKSINANEGDLAVVIDIDYCRSPGLVYKLRYTKGSCKGEELWDGLHSVIVIA